LNILPGNPAGDGAVEQRSWSDHTADKFDLFKPPVLKRICPMLEPLKGAAFVGAASPDESLFRAGEMDCTNDVPAMVWVPEIVAA